MSQISNAETVNLFKEVYGDMQNILPKDQLLEKCIPFSRKQMVGSKFVEAVTLTHETGFTLGGNSMDAFELDPAIAGAVQQTEVEPYAVVLPSVIPWGVMSRTEPGDKAAFFSATKHVVKNNLRSHSKILEILRLYGRSSEMLGTVSYATQTYRGQAFVNGSGDLFSDVTQSTITFSNGINVAEKAILLSPGQMASGLWVGMEKVRIQQLDSSNNVVAEGQLLSVDSLQGILFVDFVPVAATSVGSHKIGYPRMAQNKDMIGIHNIMSEQGTLFGIPTSKYSLWKGNSIDLQSTKFTLEAMQDGIANAVNRGGLEGDLEAHVNSRTWATLVTTESGARTYDSSYKSGEASNGFESITFYHQAGKFTVKANRCVKEGHVFALHLPDWSRSGSAEVSFKVPGVSQDVIFPLENMAAYAFRSYSDQYIFCHAPARSILWYGVNDEAT